MRTSTKSLYRPPFSKRACLKACVYPAAHKVPQSSKMVSRELSDEYMKKMYASAEAPGSEILKFRQMGDTPERDYLMHLQGLFSGKATGDLDSVPGYYGATTSYRFVQNAHALNQHRLVRYLDGEDEVAAIRKSREENARLSSATDDLLDFMKPILLKSGLTPSLTRIDAYKAARDSRKRKTVKGLARGPKLKKAGEFGARAEPKYRDPLKVKKAYYEKKDDGAIVYHPEETIY